MFLKVIDNKISKIGEFNKGDIVPLINITDKRIFLVEFLGGKNFTYIKEYNINSLIGRIIWNMQNLNQY